MIAQFLTMLDLPENRRCRWSEPDRREAAERIHARRMHRWFERAIKVRPGSVG